MIEAGFDGRSETEAWAGAGAGAEEEEEEEEEDLKDEVDMFAGRSK